MTQLANLLPDEDRLGSQMFGAEWAYLFDGGMTDRAIEIDSAVRRALRQARA
jgi:hypothetical protein